MKPLWALFALGALAVTGRDASAGIVDVSPTTFEQRLREAAAGDEIRLAPGNYSALALRDRTWSPRVTIDARAGRLTTVRLDNVAGLTWHGGAFDGDQASKIAFLAVKSRDLAIDDTTMRRYVRAGIVFSEVSEGRVVHNTFSEMGSDGMDFALSRHLVIDGNTCRDFDKTPKAHPDCIQFWSRPVEPPTADITVSNNIIDGNMQGIFLGDGVHDGIADGGFDRVTIVHNRISGTFGNGIGLSNCRDCVVRDNHIETRADFHNRVRVSIRGTGAVLACGNDAPGTPASQGQQACPR